MLKQSFEGMVVDVLVHIERCEDVKSMAEIYFPRNGYITSEDWEKVCGADDGVNVDDRHNLIFVAVEVGLDNPHAVVGVGVIKGLVEFVDERARKGLISDVEREEQVDPGNI